ncbi:MAG: NrfD/PsrC family molybdoenzyme membrane anchor subunit [Candidatus Zixiibacteriota bacterium]
MDRVNTAKTFLWMIVGLAFSVAVTRFIFGLGATTNLSDTTPWGLWIGFDVMGGVALAAGGFVITALFYIMRREEFHPLVKPAVLTAFLGYVAVIVSLLVDLGLPWNIWHMIIFWNPHSPLFEVGWCVMLYTTVLLLEFSPVPLEPFSRYAKIRAFLMKFRFIFVLLGIMLSTLHQSSLGSLILIMPFKLPALWYTQILPIQFFISAVALGLMMVSFESLITTWLYRRKPETHLVAKLGKIAVWVLGIYLAVKLGELLVSGDFKLLFNGSWESSLYMIELLIGVIIPMIIFTVPRSRNSLAGQWIGSFMVVFGMAFNRINVGGLTMVGTTGEFYTPSWMEIAVTAGVISGAILVFLFFIEKFKVWDRPPEDPAADPFSLPKFDRSSEVWLGTPGIAGRTKFSLALIFCTAIGFALIPGQKIHSDGVADVASMPARGGDTLYIDGNRDTFGVGFAHQAHIERLGDTASCVRCHHMNLPLDKQSGCYHCHADMYHSTDAFGHQWHSSKAGGSIACFDCHTPGMEKTAQSAKTCDQCHNDLFLPAATIKVDQYMAPSYADAMHALCLDCHQKEQVTLGEEKHIDICSACHKSFAPHHLKPEVMSRLEDKYFNHVILPVANQKDN